MTKTNCVHFCQEHRLHLDPSLKLCNNPIPIINQAKFLGAIFDKKLCYFTHKRFETEMSKSFNCFKTTFPL